jgi:hypothetical protein
MEYYEIIKKLIGPIKPTGDSAIDDERCQNMVEIIELTHKLVADIAGVYSGYQHRQEYSVKKISKAAETFICDILRGLSD